MSKRDSQSVLQDYFADLLLEPGSEDQPFEPAPQFPVKPEPVPESDPTPTFADPAVELALLEENKRQKLQALLNSAPIVDAPVEMPATSAPSDEVVQQEAEPEPAVEAIAQTAVHDIEEPLPTSEERSVAAVSRYLAWNENGRPEWAQNQFDALLFDVAGLSLAVPLIALGQIHPLTEELTPLFGQADWFMGLLPTTDGKIRTVNTALFVMPERYDPTFTQTAKYVVSIDGVPWGLAVNGINQPITLSPDDVKWRSERTKRPWLAGTVKSAMCALIDIPQMGQMLMEADKNRTAR